MSSEHSYLLLLFFIALVQGTIIVGKGDAYNSHIVSGSSVSFSSLSDAIEAISIQKPVRRHEQIRILSGHFPLAEKDLVLIQRLSLEIRGAGSKETIFDCARKVNAFVVDEADVIVSGITIKNCATNTTAGGMDVKNSNVVLEDVNFENNIGAIASGLSADNSIIKISSSRFSDDRGTSQSTLLSISRSKLTLLNVEFSISSQLFTSDMICFNSHLDISAPSNDKSTLPRIDSHGCTFGFLSVPTLTSTTKQNEKRSVEEATAVTAISCNSNGKCDSGEDCLSCPMDCGCAFDGYKVESGAGALPTSFALPCTNGCSYSASLLPEFTSYMNGTAGDVYGKVFAYFIVEDSGDYTFQLFTKYMAGEVLIDGKTIISSKLIQPSIKASANVIVQSGYIHNISINFYSNGNYDRYLSLSWKDSDNKSDVYKLFDKVFYSVNICGDHIDDELTCPQDTKGNGCETYACLADDVPPRYTTVKLQNNATVAATCSSTSILSFITLADCTNGTGGLLTQCTTTLLNSTKVSVSCTKVNAAVCTSNSPLTCGTGICVERFAEDCFVDCYDHITTPCPSIAPPVGHISPGLPVRDDTFGNLIRNQMLWHLPGIEHVTYGFDIIKGEGATSPLFYFGYCSDAPLQTVQDTYRGNVYTVPAEVYAQPAPRCSYSMSSVTYSSSVKMANDMTEKQVSNKNGDIGGGLKILGKKIGANAAVAFSNEKSVEQARELEMRKTGSLLTTEVKCSTSKVQMNSFTFHPSFLKDLAQVKDNATMVALMKKYGTFFYDNVVLGGKLKQVTILDQNFESTRSKDELIQNSQKSFSGTVSAPMFSASGSYDKSIDSSITQDQQLEYESNSQRTTVITYGGPPGAFGPALSNAPTNFGDWARSVDKLPVPIEYELRPIVDIIPKTWHIIFEGCSKSVVDVWNSVEVDYYLNFTTRYEEKAKLYKYTLFWYWNPDQIANYSMSASFSVVISNDTNTKLTAIRDSDTNDIITILDQYGPSGSYTVLQFSNANGKATQNPVIFDFYSSARIISSSSFSVFLQSPLRFQTLRRTEPACFTGNTQSPGRKTFTEFDRTLESSIYIHDWTNGSLYSADSFDEVYTYIGVKDEPLEGNITCGVSNQYKRYDHRHYNNTWKVRDLDAVGTHIIFFKINGSTPTTSLTMSLIGDFGKYTFLLPLTGIKNDTKQLITDRQMIKPGIGPIREVWINAGRKRDSVTTTPSLFTISDMWISAHFCPGMTNNAALSCASPVLQRRVFRIPVSYNIQLNDFQRDPTEVKLARLDEYLLS